MKRRDILKKLFVFPSIFFPFNIFRKKPEPKGAQSLSFKTQIAGFQYYKGEKVWKRLRKTQPLRLKREPRNPHDEKAIEVFWKNEKLGYIPRVSNPLLAQLMDQGYPVKTEISRLEKSSNSWDRVEVKVEASLERIGI